MIRQPLLAVSLAAILAVPAAAETVFPSRLAGHAVIPAATFVPAPADAPRDAQVSGKFAAGPARVDAPGTVPGDTGPMHGRRATGLSLPFEGQPVQGLSGFAMERAADGTILALTDNGFGSKANSPDALLFFHRVQPDFEAGTVDVAETVFLKDPNRVIPFRIAYEGTDERYLTGADFDPESIQLVGDTVWIGEEFGPYLLSATLDGTITGLYPTTLEGAELRSPDHPAVRVPAAAGKDFTVQRSGGYEGMALQPGTGLLWAMLEKPLLDETGAEGARELLVMAFDPAARAWTGDVLRFPLADGATAIGDFNFIDERRALVIERDNGEGDPSLKCAGEAAPDCFPLPAELKRVVLVDTATDDGVMRRIGYIDLMAMSDPDGVARIETAAARDLAGTYTLPYFTIEDVMKFDDEHILVAVDNNLPFASGRKLDAAGDNEFVLLAVPELLAAE
jgi:hypothetical protein